MRSRTHPEWPGPLPLRRRRHLHGRSRATRRRVRSPQGSGRDTADMAGRAGSIAATVAGGAPTDPATANHARKGIAKPLTTHARFTYVMAMRQQYSFVT